MNVLAFIPGNPSTSIYQDEVSERLLTRRDNLGSDTKGVIYSSVVHVSQAVDYSSLKSWQGWSILYYDLASNNSKVQTKETGVLSLHSPAAEHMGECQWFSLIT